MSNYRPAVPTTIEAYERAALLRNAALVEPDFKTRQAQVRWRVRNLNLCGLDLATRKDASADPAIEWDPIEYQYRMRRRKKGEEQAANAAQPDPTADGAASAPAPVPATPHSADDMPTPYPPTKSLSVTISPFGGGLQCENKHAISRKN
jgi:hypothetical protein